MSNYLFLLAMVFSLIPTAAKGGEADPMIELRVRCINGDPCRFTGEPIRVELELFNAGGENVPVPVEYFRKQGPKVILIDNHSSKEKRLGMGPPMPYLFNQLEMLEPGQSIRIPWSVPEHHIARFALRPVSVTAVFRFNLAPGTTPAERKFVYAQLPIEGG